NAVFRGKGDLRDLAQIIIGPRRSGKTTEACQYAQALRKAKVTADKEAVSVYAGDVRDPAQWKEIYKSAQGGVLIIDNIYDYAGLKNEGRRGIVHDLMVLSYDDPKLAMILTGDAEPMKKFLEDCPPELRSRINRPPITMERAFTAEEIDA